MHGMTLSMCKLMLDSSHLGILTESIPGCGNLTKIGRQELAKYQYPLDLTRLIGEVYKAQIFLPNFYLHTCTFIT